MADKFRNKYRIPSTRLQNWDYGWSGAYFITICTAEMKHYFGEIKHEKIILSNMGVLADVFWHEVKNHAKNVELDAFVVMPNHIHGIIVLKKDFDYSEFDYRKIEYQIKNDMMPAEINNDITESSGNTHDGIGHDDNGNGDGDGNRDGNGNGNGDLNCTDKACLVSTIHNPTPNPTPNPNPTEPPILTPGQQRFQNQGKNTISSIIGSYKSAVTKHAHRLGYEMCWQPKFWDHLIRDPDEYKRIFDYINNNPINWGKDKFYGNK